MSEFEFIEFAIEDHVASITFNRPRIGNGLSIAMLAEFNAALTECESNDAVRVVILNAKGKNFCVGADFVNAARGFMFALGCIQALKCDENTCPTGITTHNKRLQRGLDPTNK